MPIEGIEQPSVLTIREDLRLRKYDGVYDFAFAWYQDPETVWMVDGVRRPYSWDTLRNMYEYLNRRGELYFIEVKTETGYRPVGDVTFWQEDLPIVIGEPACRGRGIGKAVITCLVERGRALGYDTLYVNEIYSFNTASRRCFQSLGFEAYEKTEKGERFRKRLR